MADPKQEFDDKRKPQKLSEDKMMDSLEVDIYKEEIKIYVTSKSILSRNLEKRMVSSGDNVVPLYNPRSSQSLNTTSNLLNWMHYGFSKNSRKQHLASMQKRNQDPHSSIPSIAFSKCDKGPLNPTTHTTNVSSPTRARLNWLLASIFLCVKKSSMSHHQTKIY